MNPGTLYMAEMLCIDRIIDPPAASTTLAKPERYGHFNASRPPGFIEAYADYYYDLAAALRGKKNEYAVGSDVALEGLAFLEQANKSALAQQKIVF